MTRSFRVGTSLLLVLLVPSFARPDDGVRARLAPLVSELAPVLKARSEPAAVMPFVALGGAKGLGLEPTFTTALFTLLRERGIALRDLGATAKLLNEAALLELAGGDAADLAGTVGAGLLVLGQLGGIGDTLTIHLKIVDASSGRVLQAASGSMSRPGTRSAASRAPGASEPVEVALRKLADEIAGGMRAAVGADNLRYSRVAVVDFGERGDGVRKKELGKVVAAEIATVLRRDHGMLLVERSRLDQVLGEQALGQTGVLDEATAVKVGNVVGADFLVLGDVSEIGDRYGINTRIVGASDARVVAAAQRSLQAAGLIALSADAVVLRSASGATFRSVLIPGWGQFYNRQPTKGSLILGLEFALAGAALGFHLWGKDAEDTYGLPQSEFAALYVGQDLSAAAVSLREAAESRYGMRNNLLIAAGSVWLYNIVDAWMNGRPASTGTGLVVAPTVEGFAVGFVRAW